MNSSFYPFLLRFAAVTFSCHDILAFGHADTDPKAWGTREAAKEPAEACSRPCGDDASFADEKSMSLHHKSTSPIPGAGFLFLTACRSLFRPASLTSRASHAWAWGCSVRSVPESYFSRQAMSITSQWSAVPREPLPGVGQSTSRGSWPSRPARSENAGRAC